MTAEEGPNDAGRRELYVRPDRAQDHRNLFSVDELTAAYRLVFPPELAERHAREALDGPRGEQAGVLFLDESQLDLLARVSPELARKVDLARGGGATTSPPPDPPA